MRIVVHVSGYYSWEPVPEGVQVTKQDLDAGRAREGAHGRYLMRVPKKGDTYNETAVAEDDIVATILHAYCEHGRCGAILTRKEAVARLLGTLVYPHHIHRKWMKHVEIHDDGPCEKLFREMLAPHLEADHGKAPGKNVEAEDFEDLLKAYMEPATADHHADHLHAHFKLAKRSAPASKEGAR